MQDAAGKFLIEKHTILTAPSIQILQLTSQKRQEISNLAREILVVGNPTMPEVALVPGTPPQRLSAFPGCVSDLIFQYFSNADITSPKWLRSIAATFQISLLL